jgi:hypothetical protein
MSLGLAILLIVGAVGSIFLGFYSVQSLLQARLLSRWRHPSLDGMSGRTVALRGEVRTREPLRLSPIGDCLWHREVIRVHHGKRSSTESDIAEKADFSIVVEGREFRISDLPTEVHGGESMNGGEDWELSHLAFGGRRTWTHQWLPVVGHLTVVGQVRRAGDRWEVVKDPVAGMLFTAHHPAKTALHEAIKGGFGLAGAVAGLAAVIYFGLSP